MKDIIKSYSQKIFNDYNINVSELDEEEIDEIILELRDDIKDQLVNDDIIKDNSEYNDLITEIAGDTVTILR